MNLFETIVQRLRRDFFKWRYARVAHAILGTKPQAPGPLPFMVLSMVHKRDVDSYLVALKSFCMHANPGQVVVVCDPSIDDADRAVFRRHVPHIELRDASEFTHPQVPRGGCWERLMAITSYAKNQYVVQLDADTVTLKPIPDVVKAINGGVGFVLGERTGQQIDSIAAASDHVRRNFPTNTHIQSVCELKMDQLPFAAGEKYVRGCAGFTGFPPSSDMREKLIRYSASMKELIGDRWSAWGTEQVTSNYLVSNAQGSKVLPFPEYCTPDQDTDKTVFLHFIGYTRFVSTKYETVSRKFIRSMV